MPTVMPDPSFFVMQDPSFSVMPDLIGHLQ